MKNKVKIIYDPKPMNQEKIWVKTSIQGYRTARTTAADVIAIVAIFAVIAIIWGVLA